MTQLCYPVIDERGLHIVIQDEERNITRSHTLSFAECANLIEKANQAMQHVYILEKCKCG